MSEYHAAILRASQDKGSWERVAKSLLPGAHVVLVGDSPTWELSSLRARKVGLSVRDTVASVTLKGLTFYVLLRKEIEEATLPKQLLATGTGAINVDGTRIFTDWNEPDRPDSWKNSGHSAKPDAEKIAAPPGTGINCHPKGRWPANLVFVHTPKCKRKGAKKVKGSPTSKTFHDAYEGKSNTGFLRGWSHSGNQHSDPEGKEAVEDWDCALGCPVANLDRQSGERGGGFGKQYARREGTTWSNSSNKGGGSRFKNDGREFGYGDSGGASRFYKQFKDEWDLIRYLKVLVLPENGNLLEAFP